MDLSPTKNAIGEVGSTWGAALKASSLFLCMSTLSQSPEMVLVSNARMNEDVNLKNPRTTRQWMAQESKPAMSTFAHICRGTKVAALGQLRYFVPCAQQVNMHST